MTNGLHEDEIRIDVERVRRLVDHQFPRFAALPLRRLNRSGSTNVLYRLGDAFVVRLPRLRGGGSAVDKEHRWLRELGPHLPVEVPEVVALGRPGPGYGENWSILRWLEGETPDSCGRETEPTASHRQLAADLADVVRAFRDIDVPRSAATDPNLLSYRGRALADFDKPTRRNIERCRSIEGLNVDLDAALAVWERALKLPGARKAGTDRWYHGDLVTENLLIRNGRLSGVLDFGGIGIGDPTIDLHGAWELLPPAARQAFRERLGVDEAEWLRGRAWALAIALLVVPYYWKTMPDRIRHRLSMLRSVLADAACDRV